ncbi:MAG TPA: TonB-dependent receptor [Fibrobacteria bacterium]|nr:TonB-dependent receptor [Fibrobacteria bacterium]
MHGNGRAPTSGSRALLASAVLIASASLGRADETPFSPGTMKKMSLEELMDVEVTLVSRHAEKLSEAASAVQVITGEDIRRSGAATLPEALRLASNLQVARVDAREWAISARGFNSTAANKLLVMIDGRTVYTPLYSGVFWDAQHVLLEDVDRIEVVSGPGGTLWGSNAVNGVINIVTKDARSTQGIMAAGGGGDFLRDFGQGRYGGKAGRNAFYRVYGQRIDQNSTVLANGKDGQTGWGLNQGGFRMDWEHSDADKITLQGDMYGNEYQQPGPAELDIDGQNVIGRWTHSFSSASELQAQAYFDRTWRNATIAPGVDFTDELKTYDFDIHHRFQLGERQDVLWGAGYRLMQDDVGNILYLAFLPARKDLQRFNAFAQDEITLISHRLKLTLGSKLERADYSGFNVQPAARAAWTPDERQTVWGAVSRAVRTPSRIDVELYAPQPPVKAGTLKYAGSPDFGSEKLIAYELGYRVQPVQALSLSLAAFYNQYDDLRSVELPDVSSLTVMFLNGLEGDSRGAELSGSLQAASWWRLRGGYTYLERDIWVKEGHSDLTDPRGEWNDPAYQFSLQSMMDLPAGFQVNLYGCYVDRLSKPPVSERYGYDAGLAWVHGPFELSVHGKNLADDQDPEFKPKNRVPQEVPRSICGKLTVRL